LNNHEHTKRKCLYKTACTRIVILANMVRIDGVNPDTVEPYIKQVFEAQTKKWGAPVLNHLVYARRPSIFRGVRAIWTGLDASGLIDQKLQTLINRRVASINGCEF